MRVSVVLTLATERRDFPVQTILAKHLAPGQARKRLVELSFTRSLEQGRRPALA